MSAFVKAIAQMFAVLLSATTTRTATYNGGSTDTTDYEGSGCIFVNIASIGGTNPTYDFKLQDSADNSVFADVVGYTIPQITANGGYKLPFEISAVRKFVRVACTVGGTTPTAAVTEVLVAPKKYS